MTEPRTKWAIDPLPVTDLDEIEQALGDKELFERALADCLDALGRYIRGRSLFHATTLLHDLREQLEKGIRP